MPPTVEPPQDPQAISTGSTFCTGYPQISDPRADGERSAGTLRIVRVRLSITGGPYGDDVEPAVDLVVDCARGTPWWALASQLPTDPGVARVDGVPLHSGVLIGEPPLLQGAIIRLEDPPTSPPESHWLLEVATGPAAGQRFALRPGSLLVGRGPSADIALDDPEVSRRHAVLSVTPQTVSVQDAGSANGLEFDGTLLRLGASTARLVRPEAATATPSLATPDHSGGLVVNVAPRLTSRPVADPGAPQVAWPPEPVDHPRTPGTWLGIATPALLALPLALMYGTRLLLVTLVAPAAAAVGLVGERTLRARRQRASHTAWQRTCRDVDDTIARALAAEHGQRLAETPDAATLLAIAGRREPGLWQRQAGDPDFLVLRLGRADQPARLRVTHRDRPAEQPTLHLAPVALDLRQHRVVGLVGPRRQLLGLARFLLCQMAVLHGPSQVGIDIRTDPPADRDWDWARWLPRGSRVTLIDRAAGGGTVDDLEAAFCLAASTAALPSACTAIVEPMSGRPSRLRLTTATTPDAQARVVDDIIPDLVTPAWAAGCARALAPLREGATSGALPQSVPLAELVDLDPLDIEQICARWNAGSRAPRAAVGVTAEGPYVIDLAHDGPHLLVAGTTGAGKSQLLRTLVASLAIACPPADLGLILVDYKGGAAFGDCVRLPHVVGLVTDLDAALTARALTGLEAELRRRERLLATAGAADLDAYQRARASVADRLEPLGRLVIVIDEFGTLVDELPDFVDGLISIARRGRSLGIHLVLATQRPAGIVTGDIRANIALRIALRVADPGDSTDVIGVPDAATLPGQTPGRAIARGAGGRLVRFQCALLGQAASQAGPQVSIVAPGDDPPPLLAGGPDVAALADALTAAANRRGGKPLAAPWQPPLPESVMVSDLPAAQPYGIAVGLVDLPAEQRREVLRLDLGGGEHWLVAGTHRSGRTTLLRTLLAQVAAVDQIHAYIVEPPGGGLADARLLPGCGAVVGFDEPRRLDRLLQRLSEDIDERRRRRSRMPYVLLLIDGWAAFAEAADGVARGRPLVTIQRLLRDGPAAGLSVVITGDRELLTARIGGYARQRIVLKLADPLDYAAAGLAPGAVPAMLPPGRGVLAPAGHDVQVAMPPSTFAQRIRPGAGTRPFRVDPLPERITLDELSAQAPTNAGGIPRALLGVGGEECGPVSLDLAGRLLVVTGNRRSGRTTALRTIYRSVRERGGAVTEATHASRPVAARGSVATVTHNLSPVVGAGSGQHVVYLADDAESILGTDVGDWLLCLLRAGQAGIVLAGLPDTFAHAYRGLAAAARQDRRLLLLGPPNPTDTDLAGFPISKEAHPPAGRGVLIVDGEPLDIQVALP